MTTFIYLIGTEAEAGGFCSFARRTDDPCRMTAYSTARAATLAASMGDPFVPGFLIGGEDASPLSSLPVPELAARLRALELGALEVSAHEWDGRHHLDMWPRRSRVALFRDMPAARVRDFLALFDRRNDPAVIGELAVHRVEISE